MLKHGASKVVIVPKQFRGFDYEQMIAGLRPSLPDLEHVVVIGGAGGNSFEKLLSEPKWEEAPDAEEILPVTVPARTTSCSLSTRRERQESRRG